MSSSLENQLAGMSAAYLKNKEGFKTEREIKRLEENKRQLELIKGSLELESGQEIEKSTNKTGEGMKEQMGKIGDQEYEKKEGLNNLIRKNKELLSEVFGVEHLGDIEKNTKLKKEFPGMKVLSEEHKAKAEEVNELDKPLLEKLKSLGIDTNGLSFLENYSYKKVIVAIDNGILSIDESLKQVNSKLEEERLKKENEKKEIERKIEKIREFILKLGVIEGELPQDEDVTFKGKEYRENSYEDYKLKISSVSGRIKELEDAKEANSSSQMIIGRKYRELINKAYTNEKDALKEQESKELSPIEEEWEKLKNDIENLYKKLKVVQDLVKESPEISEAMHRIEVKKITGKSNEVFVEFKEQLKEAIEKLEKKPE